MEFKSEYSEETRAQSTFDLNDDNVPDFVIESYKKLKDDEDCNFDKYKYIAHVGKDCFVEFESFPFEAGSMQYAFRGELMKTDSEGILERTGRLFVVKVPRAMEGLMSAGDIDRYNYLRKCAMKSVEKHKLSHEFSDAFNKLKVSKKVLINRLNIAQIVQEPNLDDQNDSQNLLVSLRNQLLISKLIFLRSHVTVEAMIEGRFTKFINNDGISGSPDRANLPGAFAHWTWEKSRGKKMICDIQGVRKATEYILTDPCIHSKGRTNQLNYGETDLGEIGMLKFFKQHVCNNLCKDLGLTDLKNDYRIPYESSRLVTRKNELSFLSNMRFDLSKKENLLKLVEKVKARELNTEEPLSLKSVLEKEKLEAESLIVSEREPLLNSSKRDPKDQAKKEIVKDIDETRFEQLQNTSERDLKRNSTFIEEIEVNNTEEIEKDSKLCEDEVVEHSIKKGVEQLTSSSSELKVFESRTKNIQDDRTGEELSGHVFVSDNEASSELTVKENSSGTIAESSESIHGVLEETFSREKEDKSTGNGSRRTVKIEDSITETESRQNYEGIEQESISSSDQGSADENAIAKDSNQNNMNADLEKEEKIAEKNTEKVDLGLAFALTEKRNTKNDNLSEESKKNEDSDSSQMLNTILSVKVPEKEMKIDVEEIASEPIEQAIENNGSENYTEVETSDDIVFEEKENNNDHTLGNEEEKEISELKSERHDSSSQTELMPLEAALRTDRMITKEPVVDNSNAVLQIAEEAMEMKQDQNSCNAQQNEEVLSEKYESNSGSHKFSSDSKLEETFLQEESGENVDISEQDSNPRSDSHDAENEKKKEELDESGSVEEFQHNFVRNEEKARLPDETGINNDINDSEVEKDEIETSSDQLISEVENNVDQDKLGKLGELNLNSDAAENESKVETSENGVEKSRVIHVDDGENGIDYVSENSADEANLSEHIEEEINEGKEKVLVSEISVEKADLNEHNGKQIKEEKGNENGLVSEKSFNEVVTNEHIEEQVSEQGETENLFVSENLVDGKHSNEQIDEQDNEEEENETVLNEFKSNIQKEEVTVYEVADDNAQCASNSSDLIEDIVHDKLEHENEKCGIHPGVDEQCDQTAGEYCVDGEVKERMKQKTEEENVENDVSIEQNENYEGEIDKTKQNEHRDVRKSDNTEIIYASQEEKDNQVNNLHKEENQEHSSETSDSISMDVKEECIAENDFDERDDTESKSIIQNRTSLEESECESEDSVSHNFEFAASIIHDIIVTASEKQILHRSSYEERGDLNLIEMDNDREVQEAEVIDSKFEEEVEECEEAISSENRKEERTSTKSDDHTYSQEENQVEEIKNIIDSEKKASQLLMEESENPRKTGIIPERSYEENSNNSEIQEDKNIKTVQNESTEGSSVGEEKSNYPMKEEEETEELSKDTSPDLITEDLPEHYDIKSNDVDGKVIGESLNDDKADEEVHDIESTLCRDEKEPEETLEDKSSVREGNVEIYSGKHERTDLASDLDTTNSTIIQESTTENDTKNVESESKEEEATDGQHEKSLAVSLNENLHLESENVENLEETRAESDLLNLLGGRLVRVAGSGSFCVIMSVSKENSFSGYGELAICLGKGTSLANLTDCAIRDRIASQISSSQRFIFVSENYDYESDLRSRAEAAQRIMESNRLGGFSEYIELLAFADSYNARVHVYPALLTNDSLLIEEKDVIEYGPLCPCSNMPTLLLARFEFNGQPKFVALTSRVDIESGGD